MKSLFAALLLSTSLFLPSIARASQYNVSVLPISVYDTGFTGPVINSSGSVVGFSGTTAAIFNGSSTENLGTVSGLDTVGTGLNASGEVTGYSYVNDSQPPQDTTPTHAFFFDGTTMHDLSTLGGSISAGLGINASGEVVGYSQTTGNAAQHAFLYDGTTMHDLGTLGGTNSGAYSINASGQATGFSQTGTPGVGHAFFYNGSTMIDLGTLGGTQSVGAAINALGQIAGDSTIASGQQHAFFYNGSLHDLGTLGGSFSISNSLNDLGEIVGYSGTHSGATDAFVYTADSGMVDLNTLISPSLNLQLVYGLGVNNAGQIVAEAVTAGDTTEFVLLTPAPEPSSFALAGLALGVLAIAKVVRRRK